MELDRAALGGDARRVVRIVGRELLARVREKSEDLEADKPEGLHDFRVAVRRLRSWLRAYHEQMADTLGGKSRRRLGRIADATRSARDLEVHIAWVEQFARHRRSSGGAGTKWLLSRLRANKARATLRLLRVMESDFQRTVAGVEKAFARYTVALDAPTVPFATVAARLVREHAERTRACLGLVATIGDRAQAHEARIAAKRLRYLLDPLDDAVDDVTPLVERLVVLQDDFGLLHDTQLFGGEVARRLARVATGSGRGADRAPDLRAIVKRLRREEEKAFDRVTATWLGDGPAQLWRGVEAIAVALDAWPP